MYCVTKYPLSLTENFHGLSSTHSFGTFSKTNMKNKGSGNITGLKFEIVLLLNLVLVVQSKAPYYKIKFNLFDPKTFHFLFILRSHTSSEFQATLPGVLINIFLENYTQ